MKVPFSTYSRKMAIKISSVTLQLKLPIWIKYAEISKRKTLAQRHVMATNLEEFLNFS